MSQIFDKTTILYKRQRWAEFLQIFALCNSEGFRFPNFTALRNFYQNFFRIHHFRRVASLTKRQFCTSANGGRNSARFSPATIPRDFRFPNFTVLRNFYQNFFLIHHFRRVTSLTKRQFCTSANGGRDSSRFPPATIPRAFRFPNFTVLRNFYRNFFRIHHFRRVTSLTKRQFCTCANGGRNSSRFPPATISRDFPLS